MMKFIALAAIVATSVAYTCEADPGSYFTVSSCTLNTTNTSPLQNVTVNIMGSTNKTITAGTFSWKIYETGVQHFVAQGFVPYFVCNNKGCFPTKPISLFLNSTSSVPTGFHAQMNFTVPKPAATGQFQLAFTGQDQDHVPLDITGTLALESTCTTDADCPPNSYCQDGPTNHPPYTCHA